MLSQPAVGVEVVLAHSTRYACKSAGRQWATQPQNLLSVFIMTRIQCFDLVGLFDPGTGEYCTLTP